MDFKRVLLIAFALVATAAPAVACPFCSAVSLTFSEEIAKSDVVVLAQLAPEKVASDDEAVREGLRDFSIVAVVKGEDRLKGVETLQSVYFGEEESSATYLVMGIEPPLISWGAPILLTEAGVEYVQALPDLADKPVDDRLAFFLDFLEAGDEMLTRDAYDEFAKTPFDDVKELRERLDREKLIGWVQDGEIPASRRRLYITLLGIVGDPQDKSLIRGMLESDDRQARLCLDALINCYLMLEGPDGLKLVDELFLANDEADYTDTYSAVVALRVHGQEVRTTPRERLVESFRLMLERPDLADLVIPDLARWEDWESTDRLVQLFEQADATSNWVRVPVINFLQASPEPRAEEILERLKQIDPEAFERAQAFAPTDDEAAPPGAPPAVESNDESAAPAAADVGAVQNPRPGRDVQREEDEDRLGAVAIAAPPVALAGMAGLFWLVLRGG